MRIARDKLVAIMALLSIRFPGTFFVQESQRRPLKLGIRQDIIAALGAEIDPKELGIALRSYTANRNYLGRLRLGAQRLDLDGNVAGTVLRRKRRTRSSGSTSRSRSPRRRSSRRSRSGLAWPISRRRH